MKFLLNLIFASKCEICERRPEPLCTTCEPRVHLNKVAGFDFPVWSMSPLSPELRKIITAYKDHQLMELEKPLAKLLAGQIQISNPNVVIVTPARNKKNYKKRGFDPAFRLAKRGFGEAHRIVPLNGKRTTSDQRELSSKMRAQNIANAFECRLAKNTEVILFDDVLTTGSTMQEMARAVRESGSKVIAGCVLAETISVF